MPTAKKKSPAKRNSIETDMDETKEQAKKILKDVGEELSMLAKMAKNRYEEADEKTKKKILAGVIGAGAVIAGALGVKRVMDKKKNK